MSGKEMVVNLTGFSCEDIVESLALPALRSYLLAEAGYPSPRRLRRRPGMQSALRARRQRLGAPCPPLPSPRLRLATKVVVELDPPLPPVDVIGTGRIVGPAFRPVDGNAIGDVVDDQGDRGLLGDLVSDAGVEQGIRRPIAQLVEIRNTPIANAVERRGPGVVLPVQCGVGFAAPLVLVGDAEIVLHRIAEELLVLVAEDRGVIELEAKTAEAVPAPPDIRAGSQATGVFVGSVDRVDIHQRHHVWVDQGGSRVAMHARGSVTAQ